MTYLAGTRGRREAAATVWLMLVGAGLLATSPAVDGGEPSIPLWSGDGPAVTLSDAVPARAFAVTLLVPKRADGAETAWQIPELAQVHFTASASHHASNGDGTTGQAGAAPDPAGENPPWITVTLRDASQATVLESTPFLSMWSDGTDLAFSGDCEAPDPAAADPCRLAFTVEFERSPSSTSAETQLSWNVSLSADLDGAEPGTTLGWSAEIEPL
ncbi:MAG TPA: hypothetical protein VFU02_21290 [Polyangiaceae bacterium]|nr:hypothetical protein [Polyangiaceae bacterium]